MWRWQLEHAGFSECAVQRSRVVALSSGGAMSVSIPGGGGSISAQSRRSSTKTPRRTGAVPYGFERAIASAGSSKMPWKR